MFVALAWLPGACVVFPFGAFLGCLLPRWLAGRGAWTRLGLGILVGTLSGLVLAAAYWVVMSHLDLIGLLSNLGSQGYPSYSFSVRGQLAERALSFSRAIVPLTAIWITAWCGWLNGPAAGNRTTHGLLIESTVALEPDRRILQVAGGLGVGLALFAVGALAATAIFSRGAQVPVQSYLIVGPGALGLVLLGPFLGPLTTGWSFAWAWRYAAVGLPVLCVALAPFVRRRLVAPRTAVAAWCGLVTALFFWIATGLFSLGRCLG